MQMSIPRKAVTPLVTTALWLAYYTVELLRDFYTLGDKLPVALVPVTVLLVVVETLVFWVPLTLAFLAFAERVPLTADFWPRGAVKLVTAAAAAIICRGVWIWFSQPVYSALYPDSPYELPPFPIHIARSFYMYHVRVLLVIAFCYAWVHLRRTHENRIHIAELETRVTNARLDALAAQLNPHFLFNALNSIAELIHVDPDAADRMLMTLSTLLRFNLSTTEHEITVENEISLVAQYFSIEKVRLGERLDVQWSIEPGTTSALVPVLILQPLAENAIVHGIARRRTPGVVCVTIRREGDMLVMEVHNDRGPAQARTDARPRGAGVGLANTRARLECLYREQASLDVGAHDDGSWVARIALPLRYAPAANDRVTEPPRAAALS